MMETPFFFQTKLPQTEGAEERTARNAAEGLISSLALVRLSLTPLTCTLGCEWIIRAAAVPSHPSCRDGGTHTGP